jgi:hypothetical protein
MMLLSSHYHGYCFPTRHLQVLYYCYCSSAIQRFKSGAAAATTTTTLLVTFKSVATATASPLITFKSGNGTTLFTTFGGGGSAGNECNPESSQMGQRQLPLLQPYCPFSRHISFLQEYQEGLTVTETRFKIARRTIDWNSCLTYG